MMVISFSSCSRGSPAPARLFAASQQQPNLQLACHFSSHKERAAPLAVSLTWLTPSSPKPVSVLSNLAGSFQVNCPIPRRMTLLCFWPVITSTKKSGFSSPGQISGEANSPFLPKFLSLLLRVCFLCLSKSKKAVHTLWLTLLEKRIKQNLSCIHPLVSYKKSMAF